MLENSNVIDLGATPKTGQRILGRSKVSRLHIERISKYIAENEKASAAELSTLLGLDAGTMSRYLRHMCAEGLIYLAQRHCTQPGRQRAALYGFGDPETGVDAWAELPPQIRRQVSWSFGSATRDPLVAALFGPPENRHNEPRSHS